MASPAKKKTQVLPRLQEKRRPSGLSRPQPVAFGGGVGGEKTIQGSQKIRHGKNSFGLPLTSFEKKTGPSARVRDRSQGSCSQKRKRVCGNGKGHYGPGGIRRFGGEVITRQGKRRRARVHGHLAGRTQKKKGGLLGGGPPCSERKGINPYPHPPRKKP